MNKPLTREEWLTYLDTTWKKCLADAWQKEWDDMTKEDITRMAREAGCIPVRHPEYDNDVQVFATPDELERFTALVAAAERNKLAAWMIHHSLATGHGDTMEQLCDALGTEIVHRIDMEVESEREACARIAEEWQGPTKNQEIHIAQAIRARGQA